MPLNVLLGYNLSEEDLDSLRSAVPDGRVETAADREAVAERISDADVYVPGPWDEDLFTAAGKLQWVHFQGAGVDQRLFPSLVRSDVLVTNSAGIYAVPMAEHALALILAFARGLNSFARRSGQWRENRSEVTSRMREVQGTVLAIVGYGSVGQATAVRARALGMRIIGVRRHPGRGNEIAQEVLGPDRLDDALKRADYVLLSCPLTDATRGLIGRRELELMKRDAVIVNLARGGVIDEPALIEALREGRIGGAGLDVAAREPLPDESPLWQMENVIVTPHVSGHSARTHGRQMELIRENLRRYVAGDPLLNVVDKEAGY